MAVSVTVNGTDRIDNVIDGTLTVMTSSSAERLGRADFTLYDIPAYSGNTVVIVDGADTLLDGEVRNVYYREVGDNHFYADVSAIDTALGLVIPSKGDFSLSNDTSENTYDDFVDSHVDPLHWWRLGEASGTTAADHEGTQDGTYVDTPTLGVAGAMETDSNTAITLNGTSEYVTCGTSPILSGQATYTVAAWFKTATKAAGQVIYCERDESDTTSYFKLWIDTDGRPHFSRHGLTGIADVVVPTAGDWADGEWHHAAVTMAGTSILLYIDGYMVKSDTRTATNTTAVDNIRIGSDFHTGEYFTGSLDEVMVVRAEVGPDTIMGLYQARHIHRYLSCNIHEEWDGVGEVVTTAEVKTMEHGTIIAGARIALASVIRAKALLDLFYVHEATIRWLTPDVTVHTLTLGTDDEVYPVRFTETLAALR